MIVAVFVVKNKVNAVLLAAGRSWVGEGAGERLVPFLGNCQVADGPYPQGITDGGENMAKGTYFSFEHFSSFSFFLLRFFVKFLHMFLKCVVQRRNIGCVWI